MNSKTSTATSGLCTLLSVLLLAGAVAAQQFDFQRLDRYHRRHAVIVEMDLEVSFGLQTSEDQLRMQGTIVTEDGLVMFDGSSLSESAGLFGSGLTIKTTPTRVLVKTLDGEEYDAEYVGVDRFTRLGFARITAEDAVFDPVRFATGYRFRVGDWLALYTLLPEFVSPPLAADIGMVSGLITSPERFPLTVGFGPMQVGAVLYDDRLQAVGVLGTLPEPGTAATDRAGMLESFGESDFPLLGVITGERLNRLIADPPQKGRADRGWLGISLQALTPDIAAFLGLDLPGGIIVNEVIEGSPAETAGLQVGDVIGSVNGQPLEVDRDEKVAVFQRLIADLGPGASVELGVYRPYDDGSIDTLTLLVTLSAAPLAASEADDYESTLLEMKVRNLVFSDYMAFNLDRETFRGVLVSELKPGGLARLGGLQLGDIIQRVNDRPVASVEDFERLMTDIENTQPPEIIFFVWRGNKTLFVNVKTNWP